MPTLVPKKVFLILIGLSFLYFITPFTTIRSSLYYFLYPKDGIQCYRQKVPSLQDISDVNVQKNSIFFHETSCNSFFNGKITIKARQACSVESAALNNPNKLIYLLYASPGILKFDGTQSDRILKALLTYKNIRIHHLNYERYTKDTPVENLYKNGKIEHSYYAQSHASDVLRYLTLWKHGGIYLDLDIIVLKSLENLPQNFAGSESDANVAAGIIGFGSNGIGHNLAKTCLQDLRDHFDGSDWGTNGPGVITRLLKTICGADKAKDMVKKDCQGFHVFPTEAFYAIPWWNWTMYFDENQLETVNEISKKSYFIHVWNKHSASSKLPKNSQIPYVVYAQKFCPKVFQECDNYF